MLVMGHDLIWWGVPISMASVFELFNWRKLTVIHALISPRQVVRMEDGDGWSAGAEGGVVGGLREVVALRAGGLIFKYSCVSSA